MDDQMTEWPQDRITTRVNEWHDIQCRETEDFLIREIVEGYDERQDEYWDRVYDSTEEFLESVEPNRKRWREVLGEFESTVSERDVVEEPFIETDEVSARRVGLRLFEEYPLRARAIVGVPKEGEGPYPLVVCTHGAGSSPEKTFGFNDSSNSYKGFARELVKEGYAVVSPQDLRGNDERRSEYEILFQSLGKSAWGFEAFKNQQLVDYLDTFDEIDTSRLGMWGQSMGGATTLFQMPYNQRIKAGICSGFFNHRMRKHVLAEHRYSNFRPAREHVHFYIPGWFREFTDSDLISLIAPRPFLIQEGKLDRISWNPYVLEEWENAKAHYDRLGIGDRIELDFHNGGHEIRAERGIEFFDKHL